MGVIPETRALDQAVFTPWETAAPRAQRAVYLEGLKLDSDKRTDVPTRHVTVPS
jgi:hypothetical protein